MKPNINKITIFHNKMLLTLLMHPWYFRNKTIPNDLKVFTVFEEIQSITVKHEGRLHNHDKATLFQLIENRNDMRRLYRTLDLMQSQCKHIELFKGMISAT